jgi:hypothetical protein
MRQFVAVFAAAALMSCSGEEAAAPEAPPPPAAAPAATPEPAKAAGIGSIEAAIGEPTLQRGEAKQPATVGATVEPGDTIATPKNSKVRIVLSDKSVIALGAESQARLAELNVEKGRKGKLELLAGKFWMHVQTWAGEGESLWEVHTPNAVAGVRGTTLWGDTKVDAICALEGQIEVRSLKNEKAKPATLKAGNCAAQLSKGKLKPLKPKPKQVQGYLKEVLIEDAK